MTFFSIVIPTYNRADRVTAAIDSALEQTFQDFEVIVVDDGSTDGTATRVDHRYGGDSRVRTVRQEHAERGAARNRGLAESTGEFVVFLDSDDRMRPDHLQRLSEAIEAHPDADFLATKFEIVSGTSIRPSDLHGLAAGWYDARLFLRGNPLGCNVCVRRDNPRLRRFRETPRYESEDWIFLLQNLLDQRLVLCDTVTIAMSDHGGRTMRSDPARLVDAKWAAVAWIEENLPLERRALRELKGHAASFCALHAHLAGQTTRAMWFFLQAVRRVGLSRDRAALLVRILAGRRIMNRLGRRAGSRSS